MTGRYKAYSEYKDSGSDWLGEIPVHWAATELKRYSHVRGGYAFSSESFKDSGKPVIRIGDIKQDGSISVKNCKYIDTNNSLQLSQYLVNKGDLLMAMTGATIGKAGWYMEDEPALLNQRVGVFKCDKDKLNYQYFWYVLNSLGYQSYITLTAFGGAQPNISDTGMVGYYSAVPTIQEQQKIANFLDHETAKIDTLITKQEKLIELLKEKRQAVISHAVTKGLNPDAPMKDSGVEWLGEVPEHWALKQLKHFGVIIGGFAFKSSDFTDKGYPVIKISNVSHLTIDWSDRSYLPESFAIEHQDYIAPKGALVFAMTRPIISGGIKVFLMEDDSSPLINQRVGFMKTNDENTSRFILMSSLSNSFLAQFTNNMTVTNQPNISGEGIGSIRIPLPPTGELAQINNYLSHLDKTYTKAMDKCNHQITLLKERKTALISAAVTGKIDVRDFVSEQGQPQGVQG